MKHFCQIVLIDIDEKEASSKKSIPILRLECKNDTLFETTMAKFPHKTAKKQYPLEAFREHLNSAYYHNYQHMDQQMNSWFQPNKKRS